MKHKRCRDLFFFLISWEVTLVSPRPPRSRWHFAFGASPNASLPSVVLSSRSPSSSASSFSASVFFTLVSLFLFSLRSSFRMLVMFSPPLHPPPPLRPSRCAPYYAAFRALFAVGTPVCPAAVDCCCGSGVRFVVFHSALAQMAGARLREPSAGTSAAAFALCRMWSLPK